MKDLGVDLNSQLRKSFLGIVSAGNNVHFFQAQMLVPSGHHIKQPSNLHVFYDHRRQWRFAVSCSILLNCNLLLGELSLSLECLCIVFSLGIR